MPTILTHPALPLALGVGLGPQTIRRPLLLAGGVASVLPDLDVIGFRLGIPYAAELGHRGASHSIVLAGAVALLGAWALGRAGLRFRTSAWFLFLSMASHGLLDALTTGGKGVALLWPFSAHRFFAPVQVIRVSPLGLSRFFSSRGLQVLASEFLWVWLPCVALALLPWAFRARRRASASAT